MLFCSPKCCTPWTLPSVHHLVKILEFGCWANLYKMHSLLFLPSATLRVFPNMLLFFPVPRPLAHALTYLSPCFRLGPSTSMIPIACVFRRDGFARNVRKDNVHSRPDHCNARPPRSNCARDLLRGYCLKETFVAMLALSAPARLSELELGAVM